MRLYAANYVCKTATSKASFILCKHISTCKCYIGTSLLTKTIPLSLKDFNVHLFILSHVFHCTGKSKLETFMRKVYLNIHIITGFGIAFFELNGFKSILGGYCILVGTRKGNLASRRIGMRIRVSLSELQSNKEHSRTTMKLILLEGNRSQI